MKIILIYGVEYMGQLTYSDLNNINSGGSKTAIKISTLKRSDDVSL